MSIRATVDRPARLRGQPRSLSGLLRNLNIGPKLTLAFGLLVGLTLVGVGLTVISHVRATQVINSTAEVRVPTALLAARAQANLLKMQADVNGYLALGDRQYQDSYQQDSRAFAANLEQLAALGPKLAPDDRQRLADLQQAYGTWSQYPARLFTLRDDRLAREPAYKILVTEGAQYGGTVLIDAGKLIDGQQVRPPSGQVVAQMADIARFQSSFSAMMSGLRGYVTTRNRTFRGEYEANYQLNQIAWQRLLADAPNLEPDQQALVIAIQLNLNQFLPLPDKMFAILESPQWRQDLYLFQTAALPASENMLKALGELTDNQQAQLIGELDEGKTDLAQTNTLMQVGGALELLLAAAIGLVLYRSIAGPVRRLTHTAELVRAGNLSVEARVESNDEIGILAETFNRMNAQLRQTLDQIRREKKRADDLLHVVIPIGVQLSNEKDYDRLLENILVEAKSFCHAQAGVLYLRTPQDHLEYVIVRDDLRKVALGGTTGRQVPMESLPLQESEDGSTQDRCLAVAAALDGISINQADAVQAGDFDYRDTGEAGAGDGAGEQVSVLAIPLKDSTGQVAGVLQLAHSVDPGTGQNTAFDANLQQMMESFSMLAVAALEAYIREQGLRIQIQELRIEIDEVKRQRQVREIVGSDFFQDLQSKARAMRTRHANPGQPATGTEST